MLEAAARIAQAMRDGRGRARRALASEAHSYEVGTLRREVRGIVLATVAAAVEAAKGARIVTQPKKPDAVSALLAAAEALRATARGLEDRWT